MKNAFSILIVTRDKAELGALEDTLDQYPGFHVTGRLVTNGHVDPLHGISQLPDVLILGLSANWKEELQELGGRPPALRPPAIILAHSGDAEVMRLSMQAGARDFFTRPFDSQSLVAAISEMAKEKAANTVSRSQLTAFVNAKGGSGATLLAANVAHMMAAETGQRVALVDLDIQFGTLALYLDIQPHLGVLDALENVDDLDAVALEAYMGKHRSGLHILGTVHSQVPLTSEVHVGRLQRLIDTLATSYDHVIIDLPRQIDPFTTSVLEQADHVVLTIQQGVTYLRDAVRFRSILREELGVDDERLVVAVNRYDAKNPVTLADIEGALGSKSRIMCVANDYKRVLENINLGIPLQEQGRTTSITRSVEILTRSLSNENAHVIKRKGFLSRVLNLQSI